MTPEKLTPEQLKARAYDLLVTIESAQKELSSINQQLHTEPVAPVDESTPTESKE